MKILELNLLKFGPFHNVVLDLSGGSEGLHLIYGPNEAGKTSALRALEQLFFGIPGNSADNFIFPYPQLRIGARLRGRDGKGIGLFRRKGTKSTLLAADNQTPLDDAVLARLLGGLDHRTFVAMFGINHDRLQQGGLEIARGGGHVGESLFGAGGGIANLRAVRESFRAEADRLFTPRGSRPTINHSLSQLKAARKAVRDAELPSRRWVEHRQALRKANERLKAVDSGLAGLLRENSRCQRILDALPLLGRRKEILREQASLREVPILPDDFADQRRDADATLRAARKQEQAAQKSLDQIDAQIASLVVPELVLAEAGAVEQLHEKLGSHRKAQADRPGLKAQWEQLQEDAERILREVVPDLSLEFVDRLRLTSQQKVQIQNLGNRHEALVRQLNQAQKDIDESRAEVDELNGAFDDLPPPRDPAPLKDAVRRVQSQGDLEQQVADDRAGLSRLENQARVDLERLPLWSGTLKDLEKLAVPSAETIDRFESQFAESDKRLALLRGKVEDAETRQTECQRDIEKMRLEGDVPTEEELLEARRVRDLGWQLVLEAWQQGEPDAERLPQFLGHFGLTRDLADAYRQAVHAADEVADRLRREANRVAKLAQLQALAHTIEQGLVDLAEQQTQAQDERRHLEMTWTECWQPLGIEPQSPREMRVWLDRQRALVEQAQQFRTTRSHLRQFENRIGTCRRELECCLANLGEPTAAEGESLAALLGRSQGVIDAIEAVVVRRRQLTADRNRASNRLERAGASKRGAEEELSRWRDDWAKAIEPLDLRPDATPDVANEVLARIDDLFDRIHQAESLRARIEDIDRDAEQFQEEVRVLVEQLAPELVSLGVERQVRELYGRWQKADRDKNKLQMWRKQREERVREGEEAARTVNQETARLDAMCQEARCQRHDDLSEAIRRSDQKRRLLEKLEQVDEQLIRLAAGATIEDFIAEVEAADTDELPGQVAQLAEEMQRLGEERDRLLKTTAGEQKELELMDTGAAAADAAEQEQNLLARIESDARQYARLRLASAVLSKAMERYRAAKQGPILCRASKLFRELTLGSFKALRTDVDTRGENVLVGVRPRQADPVSLHGFSDGTCDQLYLALRLAGLETYLDTKEPIPFIVDDVLISFDDHRAAAALRILAELSRKTQIIFFTHHLHLLRLAEQNLEKGVLWVHRLPVIVGQIA